MSGNQIKQVELSAFLPYAINKVAAVFSVFYALFLLSPVIGIDDHTIDLMANGIYLTRCIGIAVLALGVFLAVYPQIPSMPKYVKLSKKPLLQL